MIASNIRLDAPHTAVHRLARRFLEPIQDLLVLAIGVALFGLMARTLVRLFQEIFVPALDFRVVVSEVLFMLVMVELGIVATLREIVLRGVIELRWEQVVALSAFLLALGALLRFGDLRVGDPSIPEYKPRNPDGVPVTVSTGGS